MDDRPEPGNDIEPEKKRNPEAEWDPYEEILPGIGLDDFYDLLMEQQEQM